MERELNDDEPRAAKAVTKALAPEERNVYRHHQSIRIPSSVGATYLNGCSNKATAVCRSYGAPETFLGSSLSIDIQSLLRDSSGTGNLSIETFVKKQETAGLINGEGTDDHE